MIWRVAVAALLLAAGIPVPTAALVTQAQATLPRIPLTLRTGKTAHRYSVELARLPEEQQAGMMFRTRMARNEGMLFPFAEARPLAFWMENTVLPLDIVFIGTDSRVVNVAQGKPYSREMIPSAGPAAAVLELNLGEAARIGLKPGDVVEYRLPG